MYLGHVIKVPSSTFPSVARAFSEGGSNRVENSKIEELFLMVQFTWSAK